MLRAIRPIAVVWMLVSWTSATRAQTAEPGPGVRRLAVLLLPAGDVEPAEQLLVQEAMLSEAFTHSGDELDWLLVAFSSQRPRDAEQRILAEVERLIEKGKKSYRYMKLQKAEASFEKAAAMLRSRPLTRCDAKKISQMYLYWARSVLDGGEEIGAQALLGQIARFDPKAAPDPAVMPPNLVATFDLALDERRNRPLGKVLFEIGPSAGAIHVNCRPMSAGVVEHTGVAGDELWLAAEVSGGQFCNRFTLAEGARRRLIVFSGQPGDSVLMAERFKALGKRKATLSSIGKRPDDDVDALASITDTRVLLLGEMTETPGGRAVRLGLYVPGRGLVGDPRVVPLTRTSRPDSTSLSAAFDELAKTVKGPTMLAILFPSEPEPRPEALKVDDEPPGDGRSGNYDDNAGATPWYKTWWFWTAAGVAMAGAVATGVALGVSSGEVEPSGKVVLTINPP